MKEGDLCLASWFITKRCNFSCYYCHNYIKGGVSVPVPVKKIIKALKETGKKWIVGMTGGEPLVVPNFIELCKELTKEYKIGVDTNLSINSKVREFVENVEPKNVEHLYISTHIEEREKRGEVEDFIKNGGAPLFNRGEHIV